MGNKAVVKKIIMVILLVAAVAAAFIFLVRPYKKTTAKRTHERITNYIDVNLSFEEDSYDQNSRKRWLCPSLGTRKAAGERAAAPVRIPHAKRKHPDKPGASFFG